MLSELSPIVLFVYNRLEHTRETIEALKANRLAIDSELFIYSDGAKTPLDKHKVNILREYISTIRGFKKITIIERDKNLGLADSIIDGVTSVINKYGKVIVLEDDIVTSPVFLDYMNGYLGMYEEDPKVACISGYVFDIDNLPNTFFIRGADCWGWATWRDRWATFEIDGRKLLKEIKVRHLGKDIDYNGNYPYVKMLRDSIEGKNNSWAVKWHIGSFLRGMLTLYPKKSYVQNIGLDGSGVHCGSCTNFNVSLNQDLVLSRIEVAEDIESRRKIELFFKSMKKNIFIGILGRLRRTIKI